MAASNVPGKPRRVVDAIRIAAERHRPQSLAPGRRIPVLVLLKPGADLHDAPALIVHAANPARSEDPFARARCSGRSSSAKAHPGRRPPGLRPGAASMRTAAPARHVT